MMKGGPTDVGNRAGDKSGCWQGPKVAAAPGARGCDKSSCHGDGDAPERLAARPRGSAWVLAHTN
eukprot:2472869-Alexandrium_andersonii.AAC.1